jgi:hypothetical protein
MERDMKSRFGWRVLLLAGLAGLLPVAALAAPGTAETFNTLNSLQTMGLPEPETLFLLASGISGMVYLARRKSRNWPKTQAEKTKG